MKRALPRRSALLSVAAILCAVGLTYSITVIAGYDFRPSPTPLEGSATITRGISPKIPLLLAPLSATIATDKDNYHPGETVVITGSGFAALETVVMQVVHVQTGAYKEDLESLGAHTGHDPWNITADENGNISTSWIVDEDALGQTLMVTAHGLVSLADASATFRDGTGVDFRQCANKDNPLPLGRCHWINSIVQSSNARYFEGMSNMQRIILTDITQTPGDNNIHRLTLSHQSTKGGIHAYDFLTSYEQAIRAGADAGVPFLDLTTYTPQGDEALTINQTLTTARACGDEIGPPGTLGATCATIRNMGIKANVPLPDDSYTDSTDGSTLQRIQAYEAIYGNRYLRIYADQPISNASMTVVNHSGPDTGDSDVNYILQYSGTATTVLIEVAGHLAVTGTNANGINWGPGQGSSQISGGPYHFNLKRFNTDTAGNGGESLGSQDNQIKGADILLPQGTITISKIAVPQDPQNFHYNVTGTGLTAFDLDDDGIAGGDQACTGGNCLDSRTFSSLANGTYTVAEVGVTGWSLSDLTCSDPNGGTTFDVNTGQVSINLSTGENVSCTYTNTKDATVKVVKNSIGGTGTFTYATGGQLVGQGSPVVPATVSVTTSGNPATGMSSTYTFTKLPAAGRTLTFDENAQTGWTFNTVGVSGDGDSSTSGDLASLVVNPGENITVTYQNTRQATIIVKKVMVGGTDTFSYTGTPNGSISVNNGTIQAMVDPGMYQSVEGTVPGWDLTSISCDDANSSGSVGTRTATFNAEAGETVTCTFTNTKQATVKVVKNTVGGNDTFNYATSGQLAGQGSPNVPNPVSVTTSGTPGTGMSSTYTFSNLPTGGQSLIFDEQNPTGWSFVSVGVTGDSGSSTSGDVATLNVSPGENIVVTYANSRPDMFITITPPTATNAVRQAHVYTVTVTQIPNGATPATTANISRTVSPTPDLQNDTTCGNGIAFNGGTPNVATCTVTINSSTAGTFTINASATATIGGLSITRATNGTPGPGGSGPATKNYVDARLTLSPLLATNEVGENHVITATVQQDTGSGFVAAPNGTVVTFSLVAPNSIMASFVGSNSCMTTAGQCQVTIVASNVGSVGIHATTTFSVSGVSLTRSTGDGLSGDSSDAVKRYVSGTISIVQTQTNEVGQPHTFTITVTQAPGSAPPATTANISTNITPAGFTPVGTTCGASVPFIGNTATCTVTINSNSAGVFTANATAVFTIDTETITRTTNGLNGNSGPAVKTYVDMSIAISPLMDTNPVGEAHVFTVTVKKYPATASGATVNISRVVSPTPDLANTTTCGTMVAFSGDTATCTVTINSSTPGTFTVNATAVATIGGVLLTRDTDPLTPAVSGPNGSGPATKLYVASVLRIKKVTVPSGDTQSFTFSPTGGWNGGANFGLTDGQTKSSAPLAPNTYGANETVPEGWDLTSRVCVNTVGGTNHNFSLVGSNGVSVDLAANDDVTCTFTNTKRGRILIDKNTNPAGDPQLFNFTLTGGPSVLNQSFQLAHATALFDSGLIKPGTGYVAAETVPSGWTQTSATCGDGSPVTNIDVAPGETVTCTFLNTKDATITIEKDAVPDDPQDFSFTTTGTGPAAFTAGFLLDDDPGDNTQPNSRTFTFTASQLGTKTVTEASVGGWDLTGLSCMGGGSNTSTAGSVATIGLDAGEAVSCKYTNTKRGSITIIKNAVPNDVQDFGFTTSGSGLMAFSLDDDAGVTGGDNTLLDTKTFTNLVPGSGYSVTESSVSGWDLTGLACSAGGSTNTMTRTATITVPAGGNVTCTFTNTKRGMVQVTKTVQGQPLSGMQSFTFQVRQGATPTEDGTNVGPSVTVTPGNDTNVMFDFKYIPGSYQFCETGVTPAYTPTFTLNGMILPFFVPNADDPNVDNSIVCVNFTIGAGAMVSFAVENTPPGFAHTIGYWKNWSSCTRGNQAAVLDYVLAQFDNAPAALPMPIPSPLPQIVLGAPLANFRVASCADATAILGKTFTVASGGRKKGGAAGNPAVNMAAQLLAVKLNLQVTAPAPPCLLTLIQEADTLLVTVGYTGSGVGNINATQAARLNELNGIFDAYNNNNLSASCMPLP
jgi:hypothetical protein